VSIINGLTFVDDIDMGNTLDNPPQADRRDGRLAAFSFSGGAAHAQARLPDGQVFLLAVNSQEIGLDAHVRKS
jgi:hypothetical protein